MPGMYKQEDIIAAALQRGHTEDETRRIMAKLQQQGLVKTQGGGAFVGLTSKGRRSVADMRSAGVLPPR